MASDSKDWASNANDVLQVRLKHADKSKDVSFKPNFTYPIFGNEESIFGYQGLKIRLDYTADTLDPSLSINWQQKYDPVGDTEADDVQGMLKDFLPSVASGRQTEHPNPQDWQPPGELMHQYEVGNQSYGIWSTTLTNARAKELLRDIQIFVLFFIEGGTCIDLDDPEWTLSRWRIFFVYAIDPSATNPAKSTYSFIGYSTAYTLFFIDKLELVLDSQNPEPSAEDPPLVDDTSMQNMLPCRARISQFLILPPYQKAGHGAHLYDTIISHFLGLRATREITVEDPNESFDDLRDFSDLIRLRNTDPSFAALSLDTEARLPGSRAQQLPTSKLISPELLEGIRTRAKVAPRQFARLAEMQLLSRIPAHHRNLARLTRKDKSTDANDRAYYFWRLLVKQRIYKQNADQLAQLDLDERVEKLEETLAGLEKDYLRILDGADRRAAKIAVAVAALADSDSAAAAAPPANSAANGSRLLKKRKIIDDDDDDDDEADGDNEASQVNGSRASSKKPRVSPER